MMNTKSRSETWAVKQGCRIDRRVRPIEKRPLEGFASRAWIGLCGPADFRFVRLQQPSIHEVNYGDPDRFVGATSKKRDEIRIGKIQP